MRLINIGLFLTYGNSLKTWKDTGILDRELAPYIKLKEKKINYQIFSYSDQNEDLILKKKKIQNIKCISIYKHFPLIKNKYLGLLFSFIIPIIMFKKIKKLNIDIFKSNQMWGSWVPLMLSKLLKKPFILRCGYEIYKNEINNNSYVYKKFLYFISLTAYNFSNKIIVTTNEIKNFIIKNYNIDNRKIFIQKNYVNINKFKDYNLDRKDFLYVGRLSREKNIIDMINFCKIGNCKLHIYGDGPEKKKLIQFSKRVKAKVLFYKKIDNSLLPKIYKKHLFFLMFSKYEGQPKTILEAMACGMNVICYPISSLKDIIKDGVNGIYYQKNYHDNFKFKFKKISNNARNYIKKNHHLNHFLNKEIKVYKQLIKSY